MEFNLNKAIEILSGKLSSWLEALTALLPNMVVAVFVLVVSYIVARMLKMAVNRLMARFSAKEAINSLFTTLVYLTTLAIGLMVALNVLHLEQTVTSLLAGAGIIGLALGFAFQDIAANFISGVLIAFRKPIQLGDIIETKSFMGTVEKIDLRVTMLRTFQGLHVIIPNKDVFQSPVTNYTKTSDRRIDLEVGVSYADDLEKVKQVAIEAVSELPYLLPNKEVELHYTAFGDSSINFKLMIWVHYPNEPGYLKAQSDAIIAVKKAFDANDITIPFPIRTMDFGIRGGKTLSEMTVNTGSLTRNGKAKELQEN
ncbi:MAG: mechanosensitive ion channel family protein [Reichenbachiella sp.]|uniref:mechanosensitive ion channel family protein n=1 Tax=Reichenbachiella sp. TaxID=2184521 RepID=UPI002966ADEC|nr:mechanosensitive ion channel family protein [Reichenbachiella sp.]MDW3209494.1 mechanosensitive ion channel family protein [Reichenbachiella sp.]